MIRLRLHVKVVSTTFGRFVFEMVETTVNGIADKIKTLLEKEIGKEVTIVHGEKRLGDVKRNYSDITKAREVLGFSPDFDLEMGLKNTLEYFKAKNI